MVAAIIEEPNRRVCNNFINGSCKNGDVCPFAHDSEQSKVFVCPNADCGKQYVSAWGLKYHLRSHDANRELFSCSLCPKQFTTKSGKTKHEKRHEGRVHVCDIDGCERGFKTLPELKNHILRMHDKEKMQHECMFEGCGRRFVFPHDMRRHVETTHASCGDLKLKGRDAGSSPPSPELESVNSVTAPEIVIKEEPMGIMMPVVHLNMHPAQVMTPVFNAQSMWTMQSQPQMVYPIAPPRPAVRTQRAPRQIKVKRKAPVKRKPAVTNDEFETQLPPLPSLTVPSQPQSYSIVITDSLSDSSQQPLAVQVQPQQAVELQQPNEQQQQLDMMGGGEMGSEMMELLREMMAEPLKEGEDTTICASLTYPTDDNEMASLAFPGDQFDAVCSHVSSNFRL